MEILVSSDCGDSYVISSPGCREWRKNIDLAGALQNTVDNKQVKGVILDLHDVNFINSSGLGSIFRLRKYAKTLQATLVLARPTPAIGRLLETAEIPSLIPVTDDIEQARELIAKN